MLCGEAGSYSLIRAGRIRFAPLIHGSSLEMLMNRHGLAWFALAIRRWRVRRWLALNRYRIELIDCDASDLSEFGLRVRAQTRRDLDALFRDESLDDLDPRRRDGARAALGNDSLERAMASTIPIQPSPIRLRPYRNTRWHAGARR